ncbi:MAG: acyltransferase [Clostridiales bacterium]|nr:acyltransferase [Clostridiales bacterium]
MSWRRRSSRNINSSELPEIKGHAMDALPLTPVDYVFTGVGSQPITFAFYYPKPLDPQALKKSLEATLVPFPILRSQLKRISEHDFEFRVCDDGLTFEVRESNQPFEKSSSIERYIAPVRSVEGQPLTKIALTQTSGESVLTVSVSHALADGFSYFHFLSSWARACRGDPIIPPFLERNILLSSFDYRPKPVSPEDVYEHCGLFYGGRRGQEKAGRAHEERLLISDESIAFYLEAAKGEHAVSLTENDAITALLWKTFVPLRHTESENPVTYVTCPFDFRRVLDGFPKNYFGCALCFATASVDFDTLLKAPLGDLALLVRNSVSRVKPDYVFSSLSTLEGLRRQGGLAAMEEVHLRHPRHGLIVTNLTRLPLRDIDFGSGPPADFKAYAEVAASAVILPARGGVEVLVIHRPRSNLC